MPKFMYRLRYTTEGLEGTIKEGFENRERYIHQLFESGGGSVEAVYWAYGDDDAFIIADVPDGATAIGTSLIANLRGGFRLNTTPLLTAAEMDAAVAKIPDYRPPGE